MEPTLFSLTVMFFFIMDPIGNISSYLTVMEGVNPARQRFLLFREMGIAFILMLLFNFLGEYIFSLLGISNITIHLATGVILFLIAIKILFPTTDSLRANLPKGEPLIIPIAVPLIAGPSLLASIMLFAEIVESYWLMPTAIALATVASLIVFLFAKVLFRFLGKNGLLALEKLMGMVLVLIGVQRFSEGLQLFFAQ